jgi:hypothetical protein
VKQIDPNEAIEFIFRSGKEYAKARAERTYIEEYRKSLKAILMKRSRETAVNAQERDAYSQDEYVALLEGLRAAVETEEELRWALVAAQARIDVWRSQEASARQEVRATL